MWEQLMKNQVLVSSVTGWVVAQFLKTIIDCMLNKSFSPERLVGSGGMPSSHSSTVCALVVSPAFVLGFLPLSSQSALFWRLLLCMMLQESVGKPESRQSF